MSTIEQIKSATWGTGYGATRHLVRHDRRFPLAGFDGYLAVALCGFAELPFLDNDPGQHAGLSATAQVMAKRPCKRCEKAAAKEVGDR